MKILVAEDEELSREMLVQALGHFGHQVAVAEDGAQAITLLKEERFNILISDWMMPQVNGPDLCRWIRAQEFPSYLYIILLTSRCDADDVIEGLSAGADEFLPKPFNPAELRVRIRTADRILSLETRNLATFALAKLAESRDPETGHHLERMREYSRAIARRLAGHPDFAPVVTPGYIETIYLTSPLHDIGKVGIPDCILLKPGMLTDGEFEVMKSHPLIGGETLAAMARQYPGVAYLTVARDIVLSHHERYDGSGYPQGLRGDAIPLPGRIVALADVYDALTSKRVYKAAFTHEVAHSIIVNERGRQFDPRVVDAFVEDGAVFKAIAARFAERPEGIEILATPARA